MNCAFLAEIVGHIAVESQFPLTNGAEGFAAEVHAIKEVISDTHERGLGELNIYSDSRSTLQALYNLVSRHEAIAEIKDLILTIVVEVYMHWIRAHVGHTYNERANALAKAATTRQILNVEVKVTRRQVMKHQFAVPCPYGRTGGLILRRVGSRMSCSRGSH